MTDRALVATARRALAEHIGEGVAEVVMEREA
jgi:hypothetical protein